jgi:acyl-CoA dehydrogenase
MSDANEMRQLMLDSAGRLFDRLCTKEAINHAEAGAFPTVLWDAMADAGLPAAALPEAAGGAGVEWADAYAVLRLSARFSAPVPLAETLLAGWLLHAVGLKVPDGPLSVAPVRLDDTLTLTRSGGGYTLSGTARRVPWARDAAALAMVVDGPAGEMVVCLPNPAKSAGVSVTLDKNLAGEPRDTLAFADVAVPLAGVAVPAGGVSRAALFRRGALTRAVQMAGALEKLLDLSVRYANERVQFGRPIGKFQAIQQNLAVAAGHVAAAGAAADAAVETLDWSGRNESDFFPIAAAKARVGEAAGAAAGIAHQVHGAIGFTYEHQLHHSTRRLWSWREEFGAEAYWATEIGRQVAARGADQLWPFITAA